MEKIKEQFRDIFPDIVADTKAFLKANGDKTIGEIKVSQLYGGMRGMPALICETSKLDPEEGIRFRGYSIPELQEKLPKYPGGEQPLPEGLFHLMLMKEVPTEAEARRRHRSGRQARWIRRCLGVRLRLLFRPASHRSRP